MLARLASLSRSILNNRKLNGDELFFGLFELIGNRDVLVFRRRVGILTLRHRVTQSREGSVLDVFGGYFGIAFKRFVFLQHVRSCEHRGSQFLLVLVGKAQSLYLVVG